MKIFKPVARIHGVLLGTVLALAGAAYSTSAAAISITVQGTGGTALSLSNASQSLDLGGGSWSASRSSVVGTTSGNYRSPWESALDVCTGLCATTGYWTVGTSNPNNSPNPAQLLFANGATGLKFLWGSVSSENTLTFRRADDSIIGTVNGTQAITAGAPNGYAVGSVALVLISGFAEKFYKVDFASTANAFEFSNIAAVPLPAAAWLFISAIGGLIAIGRRRQMYGVAA